MMNERHGNGDVATLVANLRGMSFQYKLHVGELPDESGWYCFPTLLMPVKHEKLLRFSMHITGLHGCALPGL